MVKVFKGSVEKFESGLWSYHIIVPNKIYDSLTKTGNKRILCTINEHPYFHAGFMPNGKGQWFIKLNKEKMKNFQLTIGQTVSVKLEPDNSKYGMRLPEEFDAVLLQDINGAQYFEKLTPGKQRSLIYLIEKVKNTDKRISKSLTILNHLTANNGKLDFKALNEAFKNSI